MTTNSSTSEYTPTPGHYLRHAKVMNETAATALRLETEDASALQAKISIGLSLQAAELACKGILLALGVPYKTVRHEYKNHDLYALLLDANKHTQEHENSEVRTHGDFLSWLPEIKGTVCEPPLGEYFERHFSRGAEAQPRNYFYPDFEKFTGPEPIQVIYIMVEHLIESAEAIITLTAESGG